MPARSWWVICAAVLVIGGLLGAVIAVWSSSGSAHAEASGVPAAPPVTWAAGAKRAPAFRLVDEAGKPVSLAAYRGRPVIVTFMDPVCRDFCPLEARQLNKLVRSFPRRSRPAIVSVSVNTSANTSADLRRADRHWRVVPEWRWGVGPPPVLARVWKDYAIGVQVARKNKGGGTVEEVVHTEAAYVIDGRGDERALFLWPFRADDVRAVLGKLAS